ncbi:hypothetical protein ACFPRL_05165 [Pseudoclavibacter helvolus]
MHVDVEPFLVDERLPVFGTVRDPQRVVSERAGECQADHRSRGTGQAQPRAQRFRFDGLRETADEHTEEKRDGDARDDHQLDRADHFAGGPEHPEHVRGEGDAEHRQDAVQVQRQQHAEVLRVGGAQAPDEECRGDAHDAQADGRLHPDGDEVSGRLGRQQVEGHLEEERHPVADGHRRDRQSPVQPP